MHLCNSRLSAGVSPNLGRVFGSNPAIFCLCQRSNTSMLQSCREPGHTFRGPPSICDAGALEWHILSVVVQPQMVQAGCRIISETCWTLSWASAGYVAADSIPRSKQTTSSCLFIYLQRRFVLQESRIASSSAKKLELLVNQWSPTRCQVVGWSAERHKVLGCGIADLVQRRCASVGSIGGRVVA